MFGCFFEASYLENSE